MEEKREISFNIITVSDCFFAGLAKDGSGIELKRLIEEKELFAAAKVNANVTVPDEVSQIRASVIYFCDVMKVNVLLITGGTAFAPGDATAEPLTEWIERKVPGLSHLILRDGFAQTPNAASSGAVAGVRNKTLIVSLPGSVDASVEGLKSIAAVLPNAVNLIITCQNDEVTHREKIQNNPKPKSKVTLEITKENHARNWKYPMKLMSELPVLFKKFVSPLLDIVKIATVNALGYVLAKNVVSLENIPKHRISMINGYATTTSSSKLAASSFKVDPMSFGPYNSKPQCTYDVIGEMSSDGRLQFYESYTQKDFHGDKVIKISKGSPLLPGTKNLITFETTSPLGPGKITLKNLPSTSEIVTHHYIKAIDPRKIIQPESVTTNQIREIGSDVCVGQVVVLANELITQPALGALAAIGQKEISVFRKPVVAILSCGDELQEPWGPLKEYEARDSNKIVLKSLISSWGYKVIDLGITPDEPDDVLNALQIGFASADVVITTGGMSMDQRDIIKDVLIHDLGMNIRFGRLQMTPGESTGFGTLNTPELNSKYWFGLPGDPVGAFVTAHVVLSPVLKMLSGWSSNIFQKIITAKAGHSIKNTDSERIEYQRGSLCYSDSHGNILETPVVSTGYLNQRNSSLFGCINASCLLEMPAGKSYEEGDKIFVLLLE